MYIEQLKNGKYRYQLSFTDERTGKPRRVSVTLPKKTEKAKREAEQILFEKVRRINETVSDDVTFEQLVEAFQNARKGVFRPETERHYGYTLKSLCGLLGADTRINKLTARYVTTCLQDVKPKTANGYLRIFKQLMRWAFKRDYIQNITWLEKFDYFPEQQQPKEKYLEREELAELLPHLKITINRYLIQFLALSGLRIGEALALQKSDIDGRTIHVSKTLNTRNNTIMDGAKTYSSNRDVFIQDELWELIQVIRKYMLEQSVMHGFRSEFFFCDLNGEPLKYSRLNKYFRENCERHLGKTLSLHSLRHTHASLMFEAGIPLEAVSLRLGHMDSAITKSVYLHITQRKQEEYNNQVQTVTLFPKISP